MNQKEKNITSTAFKGGASMTSAGACLVVNSGVLSTSAATTFGATFGVTSSVFTYGGFIMIGGGLILLVAGTLAFAVSMIAE
jgi:hypothetical protein